MSAPLNRRQTLAGLAAMTVIGCKDTAPTRSATDTDTDVDTDTDADLPRCDTPTGEQTEGPFYPGEPTVRMDIREDRTGTELRLDLEIVQVDSCAPLVGAEVDVWSADAVGGYSGYANFDSAGQTWLRGQQITDAQGMVRFTAIVPGSYPGRAVHLHVKVRAAGFPELTTQVYLPNALVAEVLAGELYVGGAAQTENEDDNFYAPDTLMTAGMANGIVEAAGRLVIG